MKFRALTLSFGLTLFAVGSAEAAPPAMPDPSAMSGIPRPDAKLSAGTVTVRCLGKAGFSDPAVDIDVELSITAPDGEVTTLTAKTQAQGRATFEGLDKHIGSSAVAKASIRGVDVSSASLQLLPSVGTALMLVEGAAVPASNTSKPPNAGGARPGAATGEPAIPPPGNAFPMDNTQVGTLTIGTFDLKVRRPIGSVVVKLTITPPQGEPIVREMTTDKMGKAVFEGLVPPAVPAGSTLVAEATLVEGGTHRLSKPFSMIEGKGMALVLAEGAENFESTRAEPPKQRRKLPAPRILRTLDQGKVQVTLWDANDQPLTKQPVIVVKKTAAGGVDKYRATTNANGTVIIENVAVQKDALYFVESIYGGAPYQSSFFGMDERGGVAVDLRLFQTTSDRSVVRSAVQYDIDERENDLAQVVQVYEVMVDGDKAFWDPSLEITAMEGSKGFVVLRPAEENLDHEEKAPFAKLHGPIAPGQLTNLSIGYLLEHDGEVDMRWESPFALISATVLRDDKLDMQPPGEPTDHGSPIPGKTVYLLPDVPRGQPVTFTMSGLRHRDPMIENLGWGGLAAFGLITVFGLMRKRPSARDRLVAARERLLAQLEQAAGDSSRTATLLDDLDRVVRRLEVLDKSA